MTIKNDFNNSLYIEYDITTNPNFDDLLKKYNQNYDEIGKFVFDIKLTDDKMRLFFNMNYYNLQNICDYLHNYKIEKWDINNIGDNIICIYKNNIYLYILYKLCKISDIIYKLNYTFTGNEIEIFIGIDGNLKILDFCNFEKKKGNNEMVDVYKVGEMDSGFINAKHRQFISAENIKGIIDSMVSSLGLTELTELAELTDLNIKEKYGESIIELIFLKYKDIDILYGKQKLIEILSQKQILNIYDLLNK